MGSRGGGTPWGLISNGMGLGPVVGMGADMVEGSNQQRRLAGQELNRQNFEIDKHTKALKLKQEQAEQQKAFAILRRNQQKATAEKAQSRQGTVLTSPLGLTTPASTANKTLLGQ